MSATPEQVAEKMYADFYKGLNGFIAQQSPRAHLSCDYLKNPLRMGVMIFPLAIYRKMEELKHGRDSSS
jgi:hypothetical protein